MILLLKTEVFYKLFRISISLSVGLLPLLGFNYVATKKLFPVAVSPSTCGCCIQCYTDPSENLTLDSPRRTTSNPALSLKCSVFALMRSLVKTIKCSAQRAYHVYLRGRARARGCVVKKFTVVISEDLGHVHAASVTQTHSESLQADTLGSFSVSTLQLHLH